MLQIYQVEGSICPGCGGPTGMTITRQTHDDVAMVIVHMFCGTPRDNGGCCWMAPGESWPVDSHFGDLLLRVKRILREECPHPTITIHETPQDS